jgi:hypothetical protein
MVLNSFFRSCIIAVIVTFVLLGSIPDVGVFILIAIVITPVVLFGFLMRHENAIPFIEWILYAATTVFSIFVLLSSLERSDPQGPIAIGILSFAYAFFVSVLVGIAFVRKLMV